MKLKAVEKSLCITGKELARICGVSDNTIYRIEGRTKSDAAISEKSLLTICEKTGVDPEWLLDFNVEDSTDLSRVEIKPRWIEKPGKRGGLNADVHGEYAGTEKERGIGDERKTSTEAGDRIKLLRKELGLSQSAFSDFVGINRANLASIETGRNRLTDATAKQIESRCEHGGAEWLLTGDERNRHYPIGDDMIEWLKEHQDVRKDIWTKMREDDDA